MKLEQVIEKILDGQAVLFAGAGFSYGAQNIKGEVPSAKKIKEELLLDMGLDKKSEHSLETISNFYKNKKSSKELIDKLKEQYNVIKVLDYHISLMNVRWKRIYTTNYDQVVEKASKKVEYIRDAIILSDDFEQSDKNTICVHLNGYIERLNADKLDNEFKLTDKSYSCDTLVGNPWFEFMVNDFEAASTIIVIGYSMKFDIDIKRLFSAPEISKKVVFIDAPEIDEISKGLIEGYGSCYPIGIKEFAKRLEEAKKEYVPITNFSFKSFEYTYHNTLTSIKPSYEEIVKFYIEGKRCQKLLIKDLSGDYMYVLNRKAMQFFMNNYKNNKVFIALSNLGNGKSVFIDMVENELRSRDIKIYKYIHRYDMIDEEIEKICNEPKRCIVIMDNYPGHMDILQKFKQYGHSNITFLLTARNGVNLMFSKQLEHVLHITSESISPLYLNKLQEKEVDDLAYLLENNSLLPNKDYKIIDRDDLKRFIINDCQLSFSNILLKIFDSSDIKNRLLKLYETIDNHENKIVKKIAIFSLIKNISNYDINFHEILDLFNADYIALKRNDIEFIPEIFEQEDELKTISIKSSIISVELIQNVIKTKDIIDTMKTAFLAADNKISRTYKELQKSMVSHSQFIFMTKTREQRDKLILIESFYNDIRNTEFARHNPFFWEQFASAYIDMKKFDLVKKCIDVALFEAKKIKNFIPFQIKTVQGRYYVEKNYDDLINGRSNATDAIDAIVNATESVLLHYNHSENNLYYVFKVVRFFSMIFNLIKADMDEREKSIYIEKSTIMKKKMEQYLNNNTDVQYYRNVQNWHKQLEESIAEAKVIG